MKYILLKITRISVNEKMSKSLLIYIYFKIKNI